MKGLFFCFRITRAMPKYQIITFGCQMNKSDSERIAAVLEKIGYQKTLDEKEADLIVVNACSVRQSAVDRIYGLIERFKTKGYPSSSVLGGLRRGKGKIILTGCILNSDKKNLIGKVDFILDIKKLAGWPKIIGGEIKKLPVNYLDIVPDYQSPFSALVPISAGCNNFCSYCVVPYVKGRETFRPAGKIIEEIKCLIKKGYKEIWLLGQNVNSYQDGKINFPKLLKMVDTITGDFWIRFTSSHPKDFSNELIATMTVGKKITPYLNLPVQAGDDEILRKMNRPYTVKHYQNLVKKIRQAIPKITLSTDVIVGFPSETKKQFENTVKLFKKIKYDMAYIAKYSPRAGTAAAKMKDDVPAKEKQRRWQVLNKTLRQTALEKNKKYIAKTLIVLPEEWKDDFLVGKSREYKTVKFKGPKTLIGEFSKVKITNALPWGLKGIVTTCF